MYHKLLKNKEKMFAVAPMMDWTDRHCRYFHRLLSGRALLYTEMVVADALVHGAAEKLLPFDAQEQPLAVQLGGSDPEKLAKAAKVCVDWGYSEINLNVGCPSDRVQSGTFGACLMLQPDLVGACVAAMRDAVTGTVPVTVKCRIGVDDQEPEAALFALAERVWAEGCDGLWVHARKAWLEGLSPKQNRDIPPLDYELVGRLKRENGKHFIGLNGGIEGMNQSVEHLSEVDGVMLGRAAYHSPDLLRDVDERIYGERPLGDNYWEQTQRVLEAMEDYCARHIANGGRLHHVTRHMVGLFHGKPGARMWRRILSERGTESGAGAEVIWEAYRAVLQANDKAAA